MTNNAQNQQPENQAANNKQPIENKATEPQTQPEKPAEPVAQSAPQKQPEKQPAQQSAKQPVKQPVKQPEPAPQPQPIVIQQKSSGGRGIATGALVLSLIALGASGFLFVQGQTCSNSKKCASGKI